MYPSWSIKNVIQGFMSDPFAVLVAVSVLLAIFLLVLLITIGGNRRRRRRMVEQSHRLYTAQLAKLQPDTQEKELLDRLAGHLPDPETQRHLVMTKQTVFNMCATRLMKQEDGLEPRVSALRVKLGFTMSSSEKQVNTTTILPLNIHLLVVQRETKKFYARIVGSDATGMVLRIVDESIIAPGIDTDLVCYFKMKSGTFHFQSKVTALDGQRIKISHSENIERSQQRKYYRIKIDLPCFVRLAGSEEKPVPTRFDDLSGGGASIMSPDPKYRKGDDMEIQFQTSEDARYRIVSEIVRVSDGGKKLHLEFGPMNESSRDRLISFILNQKKKENDSKSGP